MASTLLATSGSDISYILASRLFPREARLQWENGKVPPYSGSQVLIIALSRTDAVHTLGRESQIKLRQKLQCVA